MPKLHSVRYELLIKRCLGRGSHRIAGRTGAIDELFEKEKNKLLPLPVRPYPNVRLSQGRVSHYSTVTVDHNRYSVPIGFHILNFTALSVRIHDDVLKYTPYSDSFL